MMRHLVKARLLGLLVGAGVMVVGAGVSAEETVTIVSSLPRTGSANAQTNSIVNGIRLAIEEVKGTVGGMTVRFDDLDDASPERGAWDPVLEGANADKAIADPTVVAFIGPYNSGAAKISSPKLNRAGLAQVTPGASWPGLTKEGLGGPGEPRMYRPSGAVTFFRTVPADDIQGPAAAQWAKELGKDRVFVLHDRELYGKGIADIFKKTAEKIGLNVVGFEGIDAKAANYKPLANKIRMTRPSLVYFGGTTQSNAGQIAKDLRTAGVDAAFMVPDGCFEQAFISAAGAENLNDTAYVTFSGLPARLLTGKGKEFYEAYKARFGIEPEGYAVYGYDAAGAVLQAIAKVGKNDRAAILAALRETRDYRGALGTWSFDKNGDTTLETLSGNIVRNGTFEFLTSLKKPVL
jgi:branched-chain amino acid transport system substrate-binding protein